MVSEDWHGPRYWRNRPPDERVANAHIPKRYRDKTLDNYDESVGSYGVLQAIRGWMSNFDVNLQNGEGLFLCGNTGTGKTHLAVAMLNEILRKNKVGGFFMTAEKFVEATYDEIRYKEEDLPDTFSDPFLLKYIHSVFDVLVLDGLGSEKKTDFTKNAITSLLNSRYEKQLVTIITSEYSIVGLAKIYGPRLASILQDATLQIPFEGKDYRTENYGRE